MYSIVSNVEQYYNVTNRMLKQPEVCKVAHALSLGLPLLEVMMAELNL
jgi:hypothetical protein